MKHAPVNVTSTTTTLIATAPKRGYKSVWEATIGVNGTFGGTAVTYFWSNDEGTTKHPITSAPGTAVSSSANDSFNIRLGVGGLGNTNTQVYATTTGGTGININFNVSDNN